MGIFLQNSSSHSTPPILLMVPEPPLCCLWFDEADHTPQTFSDIQESLVDLGMCGGNYKTEQSSIDMLLY